jgi:hypothetical protein
VAAALLLLVPAATLPPRAFGDSGEYFLTAESFLQHGTPDLRPSDLSAMAARVASQPIEGPMRSLSAYRPGRRGELYAQHFWAYSAATLPVRLVLRLFGAHEYKAFALTNALLLLGAVAICLKTREIPLATRLLAIGLLVCSPLALFAMLPHPEVFTASAAVAALCCRRAGLPLTAVGCAAVAALQSPPLALLAALLALAAVYEAPSARRGVLLRGSLAALPCLAPYLFNLWAFGTPSLIADENIHAALMRPGRALEILYDLDLGLVRAAPLTLLLVSVLSVVALVRGTGRRPVVALWAVVLGVALACSGMADWNHGTSGPSRYALWVFPLLLAILCESSAGLPPRFLAGAGAFALAVQAAVFVAHGGYRAPADYLEHSWAAHAVLRRWPALYSPSHEIFIERTRHADVMEELTAPVIYAVDGRCRKALAQKRHAEELRRACGVEPPAFTAFRARAAESRGRSTWTYVDY